MTLIGNRRLDAPVDYREMWRMLRVRIEELCADEASRCAVEDVELEVRRRQGAYRFGYTIMSEMDRLLDEVRKSEGPLRQLEDDGTA